MDLISVVKEASLAECLEWMWMCMVNSGLVISFSLFYLVVSFCASL